MRKEPFASPSPPIPLPLLLASLSRSFLPQRAISLSPFSHGLARFGWHLLLLRRLWPSPCDQIRPLENEGGVGTDEKDGPRPRRPFYIQYPQGGVPSSSPSLFFSASLAAAFSYFGNFPSASAEPPSRRVTAKAKDPLMLKEEESRDRASTDSFSAWVGAKRRRGAFSSLFSRLWGGEGRKGPPRSEKAGLLTLAGEKKGRDSSEEKRRGKRGATERKRGDFFGP